MCIPSRGAFAQCAFAYRSAGNCVEWMRDASPSTKQVTATVNGPLLQELALQVGFLDMTSFEQFRVGADLFDDGSYPGAAQCAASNQELIQRLRCDLSSAVVHV